MIERNKITISFLPSDSDIWNFLQNKKETCNISEYIRNLIRQDKNNCPSFIDEEKIAGKILQALQNSQFIIPKNEQKAKENFPLSDEAKNTIFNLF
ncbi:hypothetical protein [Lysinibacillus sp. G4S2]|uniref:hypothetical protein n=1 Tax=Lysinibacillus sp. G4S2 TaxID=3055859 RepID=UPI0025A09FF0|nr:hypothetical protein [Lysinibacillus sp. G4S2]MDM5250087.1 hypothetical protein [Lysinibacillus sp. G4S2]